MQKDYLLFIFWSQYFLHLKEKKKNPKTNCVQMQISHDSGIKKGKSSYCMLWMQLARSCLVRSHVETATELQPQDAASAPFILACPFSVNKKASQHDGARDRLLCCLLAGEAVESALCSCWVILHCEQCLPLSLTQATVEKIAIKYHK